jgi:hypothetical protein
MRSQQADAWQIAHLKYRLSANLAAPTTTVLRTEAAATAGSWITKLFLFGTVTSLIGVIGLFAANGFLWKPEASSVYDTPPLQAPEAPAVPPVKTDGRNISSVEQTVDVEQRQQQSEPVRFQKRRVKNGSQNQDPEVELKLLKRAQLTLDTDPTATLRLTNAHKAEYPHGVFSQEREILAIEAELKLERRPSAITRAKRFLKSFPNSAHARRVAALIARATKTER